MVSLLALTSHGYGISEPQQDEAEPFTKDFLQHLLTCHRGRSSPEKIVVETEATTNLCNLPDRGWQACSGADRKGVGEESACYKGAIGFVDMERSEVMIQIDNE